MKRMGVILVILFATLNSTFPSEAQSQRKDTLWLAGMEMKIGMPKNEILTEVEKGYDLKKKGDSWWITGKGNPFKIIGVVNFKNDRLIEASKLWLFSTLFNEKQNLFEFVKTLISILETYEGELIVLKAKTEDRPEMRGKIIELILVDSIKSGVSITFAESEISILETKLTNLSVGIQETLSSK